VDEARKVVDAVAGMLRERGVEVSVFHDDESTSQNENLNAIVDFHNAQERDLDISVHFNAYEQVYGPMGTEVLYVTQPDLAAEMSAAIANAGSLTDRGGKNRTDLFFLNNTEKPAILIETCFVDSETDAELYGAYFDGICQAVATVIGGQQQTGEKPPPAVEVPSRPRSGRVDIEISGNVVVFVNGERVG
jgi:N-acetylmuramoyl-L-alanine amidase